MLRTTGNQNSANGNLTIAVPSPNDGTAVWKISQTMTASLLLSIIGLIRSFLSMKGNLLFSRDCAMKIMQNHSLT